jgi:hypothetical protein
MSSALVPGRILRVEPSSSPDDEPSRLSASLPKESPTDGDCAPIWTSVNGGGLGRRGELDGETPAAVMARGGEIKRECETEGAIIGPCGGRGRSGGEQGQPECFVDGETAIELKLR